MEGFPTFKGSWPWPWIDLYQHAKFHWSRRNLLWMDGRTDRWTFETNFIRSTQKSWPKTATQNASNFFSWPAQKLPSSYTAWTWKMRCRIQWNRNHKSSAIHNGSQRAQSLKNNGEEYRNQSTDLVTRLWGMTISPFTTTQCYYLSVCQQHY